MRGGFKPSVVCGGFCASGGKCAFGTVAHSGFQHGWLARPSGWRNVVRQSQRPMLLFVGSKSLSEVGLGAFQSRPALSTQRAGQLAHHVKAQGTDTGDVGR